MPAPADAVLRDLVALNAVPGIGAVLHRRLLGRFGSTAAIFRAPERELQQVKGIGPVIARELRAAADGKRADEELALAAKAGVTILPIDHPDFPRPLATIYDCPLLLYVRGRLRREDDLAVAIVGSRRCTPYGKEQAASLSAALALRGVVVVSGLARGIDTEAHKGALRVKGRTLAVLGSGVLNIYPPENAKLAERIAENGAVLSELPLRCTPDARNFPRRNRIVSGLSLGVLVVEAPEKSGALITVEWALEQGKEVFAVPGRVDSEMSRGCHGLLRAGAKLTACAEDVIEELGPFRLRVQAPAAGTAPGAGGEAAAPPPGRARPVGVPPGLDEREEVLLGHLGGDPLDIDTLTALSSLPPSAVAAALFRLEMKKLARQLPGKLFARA